MTMRTGSPCSLRWAAGRAAYGEDTIECRQATLDAVQAGAAVGVGTATAVVGDADPQQPVIVPNVDPYLVRRGVLGHVGQKFADREVGCRLHRRLPSATVRSNSARNSDTFVLESRRLEDYISDRRVRVHYNQAESGIQREHTVAEVR